ncbi:hypothetical protein H9655_20625 [Cytobacillus sp. Sa5YUA1]|uniref:Uncharacterized protein n=1 Tax=Cytobacillus stercorigallinarum TaxID=2762240 RepID=A0ABR8QV81_9BACI|nr:hypothetical protein [Cytobacillus stercorigallinarum]MBD7939450.1 hypothetical protein [Cytobacillus stercorigallinarum]
MTPKQLDDKLDEALENFRVATQFSVETFDQTHQDDLLNKDDLEELSRYIFYCLNDFKNIISSYAKNTNR